MPVTPGSGATSSSSKGNPQDQPPQNQQAAPPAAPPQQDNFQPPPDTKGPGEKGYTIPVSVNYIEVPVTVRYTDATLAKGQSSWNAFRIVGHLLAGRMLK